MRSRFKNVQIMVAACQFCVLPLAVLLATPGQAAMLPPTAAHDPFEAVFKAQARPAYGCFEKVLLVDPLARGSVLMKLNVAPDGHVEDAQLEQVEIQDADFEACLVKLAKTWSFKDAAAGARATSAKSHRYTFNDPSLAPIESKPAEPELDPNELD